MESKVIPRQVCLIVALAIMSCNKPMISFRFVYKQSDSLYYSNVELSKEESLRVIKVLEYYEIPYLLNDTSLQIPKKIFTDTELMWNLSNKSKDYDWLINH